MAAQFHLPTPRARRLAKSGHIRTRDRLRREYTGFQAALNDRPINDEVHHMNSRRAELTRKTLRETPHRELSHRKHRRTRKTLDSRGRSRKENAAGASGYHAPRSLLCRDQGAKGTRSNGGRSRFDIQAK